MGRLGGSICGTWVSIWPCTCFGYANYYRGTCSCHESVAVEVACRGGCHLPEIGTLWLEAQWEPMVDGFWPPLSLVCHAMALQGLLLNCLLGFVHDDIVPTVARSKSGGMSWYW